MNVVDSSGWLEYFAGGGNADSFAPIIENLSEVLVPSICIYEVFKRILQQRTEGDAIRAIAGMQRGLVVDLTAPLALNAARISLSEHLLMADSIILATAIEYDATLWTQDSDFAGIQGVEYIAKNP